MGRSARALFRYGNLYGALAGLVLLGLPAYAFWRHKSRGGPVLGA